MSGNVNMPFAGQRMVCMALVFGMAMYAIVAGVMLKMNDGLGLSEEPIEVLDTVALIVGITFAVSAVFVRSLMTKKAKAADKDHRATPRFLSRIVPLAIIEAGCLLAITVWMLNGNALPALAVACVLLSIAIAMIPTQDPDADAV
jgi:F0F1-type ATP synthase membrane subunit c/vacuolar-type H+-ATPase subunit K